MIASIPIVIGSISDMIDLPIGSSVSRGRPLPNFILAVSWPFIGLSPRYLPQNTSMCDQESA
jgi:hypothetical protein